MNRICIVSISILVYALSSVSMQINPTRTKSTSHFRIQYERKIQESDIVRLGSVIESAYSRYAKALDVTQNRTVDVFVFNARGRYRMESQSRIYDDGYYRAGRIYLMVPIDSVDWNNVKKTIPRLIVRLLLDKIPSCPEWLAVGYSMAAGSELEMFGPPARITVSHFSDLGEDYNRSSSISGLKELYANIGATMKFFLNRYGDHAVEQMLLRFKTEDSLREVFETSFNESIEVIEKAWVSYLESAARRR